MKLLKQMYKLRLAIVWLLKIQKCPN